LARQCPIPVDIEIDVDRRPSESVETAVYYVVSEALTNAAKHSRASEISVVVTTADGVLRASIADNGVGGAEASAGSGLIGLVDRVEALGGRFVLDSQPNHGTRISIELPLTVHFVDVLPQPERASGEHSYSFGLRMDFSDVVDASSLRGAIQALAEAIYIVDTQGCIRFLNASALEILGYDDERQLLGRPSHDTIHYLREDGTPFPAAECPLLRPRVTGETVRVAEDWFVRQDGSLVPVTYSSAPVQLSDGRGAVVLFRELEHAELGGALGEHG
jgi:PAS domain S-box-containing protein